MLRRGLVIALAFMGASSSMIAQQKITLKNPSFEDFPSPAKAPNGWTDCGMPGETPADTQPNDAFQVTTRAYQGNTYLGLVTRDNETWERVSQKMSAPLEAGHCYDFSCFLARSDRYISATKTAALENFNKPVKLVIWGGNSPCDRREKLSESAVVEHTNWKVYDFKFKPTKGNYAYIMLEAYYKTNNAGKTLLPYNGNLLIDACSPIIEDPSCQPPKKDNPVVVVTKKDTPPVKKDTPVVKPPIKEKPVVAAQKTTDDLNLAKARKGEVFRTNIQFDADSSTLKPQFHAELDEVYNQLTKYSDVTIEVGGHTNGIPDHEYCDNLSTARARAIANYLYSKGLPRDQVLFKGYGKRVPIATNETAEGRALNQRVEIKILGVKLK